MNNWILMRRFVAAATIATLAFGASACKKEKPPTKERVIVKETPTVIESPFATETIEIQ